MAAADTPHPTPTGGRDSERAPRRTPPDDALLGTELDGFKLVRRLGKGGMGAVYLAEHMLIGSHVAIKVLLDELSSRADLVARFYAEARAVNLIGHENIVSIFDLKLSPPSRYYLVMEYLEGQPLSSLARGPVAPEIALPILAQCCDALDAAHLRGIVHRDLKPENIFLTKRGNNPRFVKVLDFGVAKLFAGNEDANRTDLTQAGTWVGTPRYMAPEQCATQPIDGRADIYALGIIGYQLATGRPPFTEGGLVDVLVAHRDRIPPAPHEVNPAVPYEWSQVIMRAIAKKPKERFARASEMGEALKVALASISARNIPLTLTPAPAPAQATSVVPAAPTPLQEGELPVRVFGPQGQELFTARCRDLSRGGVYLCVEGFLPPVHTRLRLEIEAPQGTLELTCEVVRKVGPEQARAWKMPIGLGCQFVDLPDAAKLALRQVLGGLTVRREDAASPDPDCSEASEVLDAYAARLAADHYLVLGIMPDAPAELVQRRAFDAMQELLALRANPLSLRQAKQVEAVLTRVTEARVCLGDPHRRLEYDAWHGNFRGVSVCIDAGLSLDEIAMMRARYLDEHEGLAVRAALHTTIGKALEDKGHLAKAVDEYETALSLDPLHYGVVMAWRGAKAKLLRQQGMH